MKIELIFSRRLALILSVLLLGTAGQLAAQTVETALTSNVLSFAHHQNNPTTPPPQTIRVLSNPSNLNYTATATTDTGIGWLLVNGAISASGATGAASVSQDFQVGINALGLAAGTYLGTISVNVPGAAPNLVRVTLKVDPSPQLVLSPASLSLTAQAGTSTSTQVIVNSTGTAIPFTAAVTSAANLPAWLSITPLTGSTGTAVTIVANTTGLSQGLLPVGRITFTAQTPGGGAVTLPVIFSVTGAPTLTLNPTTTTIGFQLGTAQPPSKLITVTTSGTSPIQYTAQVTSGSWLTLSSTPSTSPGTTVLTSSTPNGFHVFANPAGLAAGTYDGKVVVTSPSIPGTTQELTVRLIVSILPLLQTTPDAVSFNHTLGTTVPSGQLLSVTSTSGQQLPFQVTETEATGGDWLAVAPPFGITNQNNLLVSLNATRVGQLTAGTYTGSVTITSAGTGNSPLTVPVTLTISGSTLINVSPSQLTINTQQGQTPPIQSFQVTSTDGSNQPFNITVEPAATNWLVLPASGTTGPTGVVIPFNVNPAVVTPGTYDATIVITPTSIANAVPQRIPVRLTVIGSSTVTANPTRVDFTQAGTQNVTLTSTVAGVPYLATASQPWITVTPPSGTLSTAGTPLAIAVSTTGLTPGNTYEGTVTVSVSNITTLNIPVRFMYQSSATLVVSATQLNFTSQTGSTTPPAAQNLGLTSSGAAIPFTAAAATNIGGNWLSVSPTSGTTAAQGGAATNVAVSVNPTGLTPGTYTGTITLTGQNSAPVTVAVSLVVTNPAPPVITSVLNGATNSATPISPGLIIAIKGTNLGPATTTGVGAEVQNGFVTTTIGEVRVLFDNVAAPVLFARQDQVNAIAPYFLANRASTKLVVEYRGTRSAEVDLRVAETAPGIFTLNATGAGQGAVLNQDNSVNGPNNPAARNSIVSLYATGEGQVIPAGADGRVNTATNPTRPAGAVSVRISGMPAEVTYAGSAAGLVSGAVQVNVRVPQSLQLAGPAVVPVELMIGNSTSATAQNVSIVVRP